MYRVRSSQKGQESVIKSADPDIVGFQEVRYDSDTFTSGDARQSKSKSHFQLQHILNLLNDNDDGESDGNDQGRYPQNQNVVFQSAKTSAVTNKTYPLPTPATATTLMTQETASPWHQRSWLGRRWLQR